MKVESYEKIIKDQNWKWKKEIQKKKKEGKNTIERKVIRRKEKLKKERKNQRPNKKESEAK